MTDVAPEKVLTLEELLEEYTQWKEVLDRDSDDFDAIVKVAELYRFAIVNYNEPGSQLLLRAVKAVSTVEKDRR